MTTFQQWIKNLPDSFAFDMREKKITKSHNNPIHPLLKYGLDEVLQLRGEFDGKYIYTDGHKVVVGTKIVFALNGRIESYFGGTLSDTPSGLELKLNYKSKFYFADKNGDIILDPLDLDLSMGDPFVSTLKHALLIQERYGHEIVYPKDNS